MPRPTPVGRPLRSLVPEVGRWDVVGDPETLVTGITLDSRDVRPGDLFAALPGEHTHGRRFIEQARRLGAVAVVTDQVGSEDAGDLPVLIGADPRADLGAISAAVYGHPGRDLTLVGVTGTNGKTTVTHLVSAGLRAAGNRVGMIGTAGVSIHDELLPAVRTTPEAPDTHALLALMRERGVSDVVMEVSSHALVLGRVDGLTFDLAAFTNLSPDHLDFHGDMESYFAAKAMLFTPRRSRRAVVGVDDEWGRRLAESLSIPVTTVALDRDGDVTVVERHPDEHGRQRITLNAEGTTHSFDLALPGDFNAQNASIAWAMLHILGVTDRVIGIGLSQARVSGRMEIVDVGQPFAIIVDYAHSPDAVDRVLRSIHADGRRIVVLGCGGDRDRAKRPLMGRIAADGADVLIVTDDNPRSEDPQSIRAQMLEGIDPRRRDCVLEIADRRAAIATALQQARPGDVVLILGKGHETGQEIAGITHPFDDRDVARDLLARETA